MRSIDRFDRHILDLFQSNTRLTTSEISERIGLSPTACQRRLNRMRGDGYIEQEIAVVSPKLVGRPLIMVVQVFLERGESSLIQKFKHLIRQRDEIMQAYYVTGEADFLMLVSMRDMEEYEKFTHEVFFDNPDVKNFETSTVMDRTKVGFALPIEQT